MDNFDFTFLLKVDTDTYVQVPKFIDYLNQFANTPASYYGVHGYLYSMIHYLYLSTDSPSGSGLRSSRIRQMN